MPTPFDWDKLRIFHEAAKVGSFTQAAQALQLSASAISRQVGALEQEIKAPLFQRHARGLLLTEQGEILYHTTQNVFKELADAHAQLTESHQEARGKLCITTTFGMGSAWLIEYIAEFKELYPAIQLQLRLDDKEVNLSLRHADCAIRLHAPQQSELIQKKLFTVHMHIYGAPCYLKKYGSPQNIYDLAAHKLITFGQPLPHYLAGLNWLETIERTGAKNAPLLQINNLTTIKIAVKRGLGLAILPDYLVKEETGLVRLLPEYQNLPSFDAFFCYPAFLKHSAKLKAFRDFIVAKARLWTY